MKEVPRGWVECKIGEISTIPLQRIPADDEVFPYIDISSINRETKQIENPEKILGSNAPSRARKVVQANDILVSMTRPNLNAVAFVDKEYDGTIASTGFDVIRCNGVNPKLIYYLVRTDRFVNEMTAMVKGALYPAVSSKDIRSFQFPLPPLPEQKRIADKLDALMARIESCKARLDAIPETMERFRQMVLDMAITGRLTEDWREEHKGMESVDCAIESLKESRLKNADTNVKKMKIEATYSTTEEGDNDLLPETWKYAFLGKLCESFEYGSSNKSQKSGKVPVLRMGNLQNGHITWDDLVYTSNSEEIRKYRLKKNTVLFNRTNSPELVGKTAIYLGEQEAVFAGYLIRINSFEILDSHYLNYALNSDYAREYCRSVKSDAVSQSNINAQKLARFEIPLPPKVEQEEIVRRIERLFKACDQVFEQYKAANGSVVGLSQTVLSKAFRGALVPQNPADEPAEKLLERIKKAKLEQQQNLKKQGKHHSINFKGIVSVKGVLYSRTIIQKSTRQNMKKDTVSAIKEVIIKFKTLEFTFDEIRKNVALDYEQLRDGLFELLNEKKPVLRQVFDKTKPGIKFKKVEA